MPKCSDKPGVANRGTPGRCFKKGLGVGFGIGIQKGKESLKTGKGLTRTEVRALKKDSVRDIALRRNRMRPSKMPMNATAISRMSKLQLTNAVIASLVQHNEIR